MVAVVVVVAVVLVVAVVVVVVAVVVVVVVLVVVVVEEAVPPHLPRAVRPARLWTVSCPWASLGAWYWPPSLPPPTTWSALRKC